MEKALTEKEKFAEEVKQLYLVKTSIDDIANKFSVKKGKIKHILFKGEKTSEILYKYFIVKNKLNARTTRQSIKEMDEMVLSLYKEGKTFNEIATTLSIKRYAISLVLHKYGIFVRKKDLDKEKEIIELYKSGQVTNYNELGRMFNKSGVGIANIFKRHGIYNLQITKELKEQIKERNKEIIERFEKGIPLLRIQTGFNMSDRSIKRIIFEKSQTNTNSKWRQLNDSEKEELKNKIIELFKTGNTIKQISKLTEYPTKVIRNILVKNQIYSITSAKTFINKDTIERDKKILKQYKKGKQFSQLSRAFNLNEYKIWQIIKKAGAHHKFETEKDLTLPKKYTLSKKEKPRRREAEAKPVC